MLSHASTHKHSSLESDLLCQSKVALGEQIFVCLMGFSDHFTSMWSHSFKLHYQTLSFLLIFVPTPTTPTSLCFLFHFLFSMGNMDL